MAINLQVEKELDATAQSVKDQNGKTSPLALSDDKVGIGTQTPGGKLTVNADWDGQNGALTLEGEYPTLRFSGKASSANQQWLIHESDGAGNLQFVNGSAGIWDSTPVMQLTPDGNVAIGGIATPEPGAKLDVAGEVKIQSDSNPIHFTSVWRGFPSLGTNRAEISNDTGQYKALMLVGNYSAGMGRRVAVWDRLEVNGILTASGTCEMGTDSNPIHFTSQWNGFPDLVTNHAEISNDTNAFKTLMIVGNQSAGMGRRVSIWDRLEVNGFLGVTGDVEVGGDIRLTNADCAEDFNIGTELLVEPGTVMVLGEDGALFPSQHAYDKRVAGVVSGAGDFKPGIVLDKQISENNRQPIALLGKVFCKVDAGHGTIEIGDLLTTSPNPGHAMKADNHFKAFGTVIGKALRPLSEGQGLIPILIALQ